MPKDVDQMTIDELQAKAKTLRAVALVLSGLAAAYAVTLLFWWLAGRWTTTQALGVVPLFALVAAAWPAWSGRRQVLAALRQRTLSGGGS